MKRLLMVFFGMIDPPIAGEVWTFNKADPFPPEETVTVIEVRSGWVRYKRGGCSMLQDERMTKNHFTYCYRRES